MTATLNMNGAMNSQLSIVGQLRNEFLGLYSIYAAQNFLRAVVDIGGELENQKIAMALSCKMKAKLQPYSIRLRNWLLLLRSGLWI